MDLLYKTQKPGQWLKLREQAKEWLDQRQQVPADAVCEFKTRGNTLSVFEVDREGLNSARIVAAILSHPSAHNEIDSTDCLVFDAEILTEVGIQIERNLGQTPDRRANEWHFDLLELTGKQLVNLTTQLVGRAQFKALLQADLLSALQAAAASGDVDKAALREKVRKQLG